ncbi:nucleoside triphosphate pyrophosphohydrolase family protein [Tautonia rosea]|uniref:nucleoside triphosphate pyrophosphohydrolase family protein n=1 Tax=Tautonia rosea TaxID=2728037 RepID=UPI001475444F|nr:nucleoside triphosphate pyrophosphohydrolase family protein [Tautonia rosea]
MDLSDFQYAVSQTDCLGTDGDVMVPLLGLAGEVGELQNEYKKALRDGDTANPYRARFAEELGDVLWYVANLATKLGFDLDEIAAQNLEKARDRWGRRTGLVEDRPAFDEAYPEHERLPRKLTVVIKPGVTPDGKQVGRAYIDDKPLGDHLTDNAYVGDGYRFHDTFHFAFAAVLGWSPITRWLLNRKRKSRPEVDEVEDGARAKAAEEAISLFVFSHAKEYNWLVGNASVSSEMLRSVRRMANGLEVSLCSSGEWEDAILQGFAAWRLIHNHQGGVLTLDLDSRTITAGATEHGEI